MKFAQPDLIHTLWLTAALVLFYLWAFKKRREARERFAQAHLLPELVPSGIWKFQKLSALLIVLAVFFCFVSLVRPQWGFRWEEVKKQGLDILIAIDTSKSMLAEDVLPNRLERSKLAVRDLIKKLRGDRIGLIAFSGGAFLQCPLTVDYNGFLLSLNDLNAGTIPRGGTSIAAAIREAIKSYEGGQKKYKALVIITDGEAHTGDSLKAAEEAKKQGIKIFYIGIGTKEGELIPITDKEGQRSFLKDNRGNVVKSRLDEAVLQKAALAAEGSYVRASGAEFGLDLIYEEKLSKLEKREIESKMRKRFKERFQIPLFFAFLLLAAEMVLRGASPFLQGG